jgi:transcriptional regulator with XRE-family HTH domain
MKNENTKRFLELVSPKESGWLEKAIWRQENEDWLDLSFSIAVKILSALRENKNADNSLPKNQKELAEVMGCTPQYINKLLRGQENLQIETICKIQRILNIRLIEVPSNTMAKTIQFQPSEIWVNNLKSTSPSLTSVNRFSKKAFEETYAMGA